jgi:hypothetical protein
LRRRADQDRAPAEQPLHHPVVGRRCC